MKTLKIPLALLLVSFVTLVVNDWYYLSPLNEELTQQLTSQRAIQSKLNLQRLHKPLQSLLFPQDLPWSKSIQVLAKEAGVIVDGLQAQPDTLQGMKVLLLHLKIHGMQYNIFNLLIKLFSSEMPMVMMQLQIAPFDSTPKRELLTGNAKNQLSTELSLLLLDGFAIRPIRYQEKSQSWLFCNSMNEHLSTANIPLHAFSMQGYLAQNDRKQALLTTGLNFSTVVNLKDTIGEENAVVTDITPHAVAMRLPNQAMALLTMDASV